MQVFPGSVSMTEQKILQTCLTSAFTSPRLVANRSYRDREEMDSYLCYLLIEYKELDLNSNLALRSLSLCRYQLLQGPSIFLSSGLKYGKS